MKKIKTIIFIFLASAASVCAQQGSVASGGQATGAGGSASYSMGQIDYTLSAGSGGKVSRGLQQPYEILILAGIKETGINLSAAVYPNPTNDHILLKVDNEFQELSYQLYDMNGKLLSSQKINGSETSVSMTQFVNGTYTMKVINRDAEIKIFKIIKSN